MLVTSLFRLSEFGSFNGFTLTHFKEVISLNYLSVILNSLSLSLTTAIICLFIAYPLASTMARAAPKWKTILLILLAIPFWTNFLLHVCAWQFVLEKTGFLNTLLLHLCFIQKPLHLLNTPMAVKLMMVYYFLPFTVLPLFAAFDKFQNDLIDAAHDLGANRFTTFRTIVFPLLLPAIRAGFFLVFIPAFGEFAIPELMGGDRHYFVGNVVSLFLMGTNTAPLGTAFIIIAGICLIFASLLCNLGLKKLSKVLSRRRVA